MLYSDVVLPLRTSLLLAALAPTAIGWPIQHLHQPRLALLRLPAAERAIATRLLRPELGPLFQGESPQVIDQALRSFRVERLRLGPLSALAVQPTGDQLCSPTGNCAFWIIDLQHRRILLRAIAIQRYAVDRNPPSAMPDIVTSMHGSAFESDLTRWHYDGARYTATACAAVDYAGPDGNRYPDPKITPHPCNSEGNDRSE
jgi:hypothetical protein